MHQEFKFLLLNKHGNERARRLAESFNWFLNEIEPLIGKEGRYVAIVRTKLEEASLFAMTALASREENQKQP